MEYPRNGLKKRHDILKEAPLSIRKGEPIPTGSDDLPVQGINKRPGCCSLPDLAVNGVCAVREINARTALQRIYAMLYRCITSSWVRQ